jgi:hypothetical protein
LALVSVALLVAALVSAAVHNAAPHRSSQPTAATAGKDSEFIVRCPATGEVKRVDPIFAPGGTAGHYHLFFGNQGSQVNPGDGGTGVLSTSTDNGMENGNTNCEVGQGTNAGDTAGYWVPVPMFEPTNSFTPNGYDSSSSLCATGPHGHTACPLLAGCTELSPPKGNFSYSCTENTNVGIYIRAYYTTQTPNSVSEFPDSTTMLSGDPLATVPEAAGNSFPLIFDCGANPAVQTPYSSWPYNCQTSYSNGSGGTFSSQGLVMILEFPRCWKGTKTWPQPNNTNGVKVPGFTTNQALLPSGASEDLAYPNGGSGPGGCPSGDTLIPHLTERVHFIGLYNVSQSGSETVDPSSCTQGGANITGCTSQPAYNSHGTIGLEFSSDSSSPGGAPVPGMFWTAHADYWQTWQQGGGIAPGAAAPGTLDDLTEDCLVQNVVCGFVGSPPSGSDYPNDNPAHSAG